MAQEDFVKCNSKTTESDLHGEHEIHVSPTIWQPLQSNVVKINWDAAVNKKKGCIGIGVIARDCQGNFMGAHIFFQKLVVDLKGAKTIAALHAVIFCKEVGFFVIVLEGDALHIIKEINWATSTKSKGALDLLM